MISNKHLPACLVSGWLGHDIFSHYSSLVPTPIVTINSGTIAAGSALTLTCSVELSPAVDVPVTVTTEWTGPAGFMTTTTAQPVMGSNTTYTSTAMVTSFGGDESGVYNCTATVASVSPFLRISNSYSGTASINIGKSNNRWIMNRIINFNVYNLPTLTYIITQIWNAATYISYVPFSLCRDHWQCSYAYSWGKLFPYL